jgi:hypothetical protein
MLPVTQRGQTQQTLLWGHHLEKYEQETTVLETHRAAIYGVPAAREKIWRIFSK